MLTNVYSGINPSTNLFISNVMFTVRLEPNITYGAVQVWQDDGYKLVCADQFDDVDAQVVCRGLGKQNGISICCSVFGDMKHPISINNVACTGQEDSILQCQHNTLREACPSKKYAAVACSDSASSGGLLTKKNVFLYKIRSDILFSKFSLQTYSYKNDIIFTTYSLVHDIHVIHLKY